MDYQIEWTPTADREFYELVSFIADTWSDRIVSEFVDKAYKTINLLSTFPELGIQEPNEEGIRLLFIRKYTKIYYRIEGDRILILNVFDTRRDPDSKPF